MDYYLADDDRWVPNMNCLAMIRKAEAEEATKEVTDDHKDKADKHRTRTEAMNHVKKKIEDIIGGLR